MCFGMMYSYFNIKTLWVIALMYDAFAFVPQGLIGEFMNRHRKFDMGTLGACLMLGSIPMFGMESQVLKVLAVILIAVGNACLHECGAIATVSHSEGKLFPTALFVGGGSLGVITGTLLGKALVPLWWYVGAIVIIEALVLFTNRDWLDDTIEFPEFNIAKAQAPAALIIPVAIGVTAVRSLMGYAIPTAWNKTTWQAVLLFVMMGIGKAFGGYATDKWGARRTGLITTLAAIPFLVWGNNLMIVSIVGVFLFSMTMSITFGMLLSVLNENPGLAFGATTLGLFIGTVPMVFMGSLSIVTNIVLVIGLSVVCFAGFYKTLN